MFDGERPQRIIYSMLEGVQYLVNVKVWINFISIPTFISLCLHCKWTPKARKKKQQQNASIIRRSLPFHNECTHDIKKLLPPAPVISPILHL